MMQRAKPDIREVYFDWGDEPLRQFKGGKRCRVGHRWTAIPPWSVAVARAAGLRTVPNWYCGPTVPTYCERCGVIQDQKAEKRLRWRVWTRLGELPTGSFVP